MKKLPHYILHIALLMTFIVSPMNTFADEVAEKSPTNTQSPSSTKKKPHVITGVLYEIKRTILEAALEEKLNLKNGPRNFNSEEDFLAYVKNKKEALINIRAIEASSSIDIVKTYNKEKAQHEAILTVQAHAGFNILVLPYPKYSSNSGLLLSARGRDYNFLGSLQRLIVDVDYTYDREGRSGGAINSSFQYPLQFGKNLFTLSLGEKISYRSDNKFYNKTSFSTKHSYSIHSIISWSSSLSQDFISETDLKTKAQQIFSSGKSTLTSGPSILLTPTPLPFIANITYNPSFTTSFEYSLTPQDPTPEKRYNISPAINQSINFGQVNEVQNFRKGMSFNISNGNSYSVKTETWHNSISLETKLHATVGNVFGVDARIYGVQNFYTYLNASKKDTKDAGSGVGDRLRGVLDDNFKNAANALTINMSLLLKMFSFTPFAEFHLGLFSDFGVRTRIGKDVPFELEKDLKATVGVEVLAFALFARSIILRISYGIDLTRAIRENKLDFSNREIFIGLSRYF